MGPLTIVVGPAGVCRVAYGDEPPPEATAGEATRRRDPDVAAELSGYFARTQTRFRAPVDLRAVRTPFHRAVLSVLRARVAYGETVTYGELAEMAGRPGAARAAGSACGANPVVRYVPCHRVVAARGLGGYGSTGPEMKRRLLEREGVTF